MKLFVVTLMACALALGQEPVKSVKTPVATVSDKQRGDFFLAQYRAAQEALRIAEERIAGLEKLLTAQKIKAVDDAGKSITASCPAAHINPATGDLECPAR